MTADLQEKLAQAAGALSRARYVVALVGAGLSAESGIPTYRGTGGLWTKHGEPPLLSYQEFSRDPRAWWESRLHSEVEPGNPIYEMKLSVDRAAPNPGHYSLVELERAGLLRCVITQNVDNLQRQAGAETLLEIHGNRTMLRCLDCEHRLPRQSVSLAVLPPRCPRCGGVLKMDTVMFGEPIPPGVLRECREQTEQCDCMLLIGTSGTVNPAAMLPRAARERGAVLIEVNPEETALTPSCHLTLRGASGDVLPRLTERVMEMGTPGPETPRPDGPAKDGPRFPAGWDSPTA